MADSAENLAIFHRFSTVNWLPGGFSWRCCNCGNTPYGTWISPITPEVITTTANSVEEVIVDRVTCEVYHIERRPSEDGRCVLVHTVSNRDVVESGWNVRTGVQEYGGAAAIVYDSVAYFSHVIDGRIYRVNLEGKGTVPEAITPADRPYRYACLEPLPSHPELLISVLEDHTNDTPSEVVNTLIVINTTSKQILPLISGVDFYASPKVSPDSKKLAWVQWSHPDMPWEGGEIYTGDILIGHDTMLSISNVIHIAGKPGRVSASYPSWASDDVLIFTSDESGYLNPWKYSKGKTMPLLPQSISQDFGHTFWVLHFSPYAILDQDGKTAVFSALKDGRDILYRVDLDGNSEPEVIDTPFVDIDNIHALSLETHEIVFVGQKTNSAGMIVKGSLSPTNKLNISVLYPSVTQAPHKSVLPTDVFISEPRPITLAVPPADDPLYVIYYPPYNPQYSGSNIEGEKPPCIVNVHGGPTGYSTQALSWGKQYFTSRGWAWLDVNYGGSSGFGRKYIERLVGNWGIVDVVDCTVAPKAIAAAPFNLVDPKRLVIRGGSAGGFTVLAALSIATDVKTFAAATSLYGVSNLQTMVESTHKFESQYLHRLLGGTPVEVPEVYRARSAVYHADKIVVPLLILQGDDDHIVPKDQAETIYNSIKDRGGVVEYKLYPGEGHGWRHESTIQDSYERELRFYERVLGLKN